MYAVIKTGGKQYRVQEGAVLRVEKLAAETGAPVEFDRVLLISDGEHIRCGSPYLEGGKVTATISAQGKRRTIEIVKFRRRKHHRKQAGHRQPFTEVRITGISG